MIERPQPPESMFGVDGSPFTPVLDTPEWVQVTFLDGASPVANPEHGHLADAHIGYLWARVDNNRKGERVTSGGFSISAGRANGKPRGS